MFKYSCPGRVPNHFQQLSCTKFCQHKSNSPSFGHAMIGALACQCTRTALAVHDVAGAAMPAWRSCRRRGVPLPPVTMAGCSTLPRTRLCCRRRGLGTVRVVRATTRRELSARAARWTMAHGPRVAAVEPPVVCAPVTHAHGHGLFSFLLDAVPRQTRVRGLLSHRVTPETAHGR